VELVLFLFSASFPRASALAGEGGRGGGGTAAAAAAVASASGTVAETEGALVTPVAVAAATSAVAAMGAGPQTCSRSCPRCLNLDQYDVRASDAATYPPVAWSSSASTPALPPDPEGPGLTLVLPATVLQAGAYTRPLFGLT